MMKLPNDVEPLGPPREFDRDTVPDALLTEHSLAAGRWARLTVLEDQVVFVDLDGGGATTLRAGESAAVPPILPHRVEPGVRARFRLEFFREARGASPDGGA